LSVSITTRRTKKTKTAAVTDTGASTHAPFPISAIFPIIAAIFLMKDFELTDTQNAHDGKTLDGVPTGEGEIDLTPVAKEPLSSKYQV
jgi:hypothetical protein